MITGLRGKLLQLYVKLCRCRLEIRAETGTLLA